MVFSQIGHLAITSESLAAIIAISTYIGVSAYLCLSKRALRGWDIPLAIVISCIQIIAAIWMIPPGVTELGVFPLSWLLLGFIGGYGVWRVAGGPPLRGWPWYRFGLLASLIVLMTDMAVGILMPLTQGNVWTLGGAGWRDALCLLPPVLTLTFWGILDCRSPLSFCSTACRNANRCRYGLDGKKQGDAPGQEAV